MNNPFKQPETLWKLTFAFNYSELPIIEDYFENITDTTSCHEIESSTVESMPDDLWQFEAYFETRPDIEVICKKLGDIISNPSAEIVEDIDWIHRMHDQFTPLMIGRFFVTNPTHHEECPLHMEKIIIDSSRAFGTGEHHTTQGCIEAMEELSAITTPKFILDIGTGTGILAIAAAKIWRNAEIIGSDIETVAAEISTHHANINDVSIEFYACEGLPPTHKKADLIVSNILANPLIELAQDFEKNLEAKGYIILSGFLDYQLPAVLEAYQDLGLSSMKVINKNNWITLVLQK